MANVNAPRGLWPIQSASGAPSNYEMVNRNIAYDAAAIWRGDPVLMLNTGYVSKWVAGSAQRLLFGIFWGCSYLSSSQGKVISSPVWPGADVASTAQETITAQIIPCNIGATAPVFQVQSDATGVTFADIGLNCEITMAAGNSLTGWSAAFASGIADTATLPFNIIGLSGGPLGAGGSGVIRPSTTNPYGGSPTGAYAWMNVRPNLAALQGI
jgi:hypothetical protein